MINENQRLVPNGRTLWELEQRFYRAGAGFLEVADNLQRDIGARVRKALEHGEQRRDVSGTEAFAEYRRQVREIFLSCLGGLPKTEAALNGRTVSALECEGFVLEKVIFESRPRVYVTCNLYRPFSQPKPGPAVLIVEGHVNEGKAYPEYQRLAQMLVHAGFVVLVMDPVGQGERFEHYEPELEFKVLSGPGEHDLLDNKCRLLGLSLARYFVHDDIRGLEYLASRPEVDPERIAVTGHSGGGTQTFLLMAAASDRLAAAAPCSYTTDYEAMLEYGKDQDHEQTWTGILKNGLDYADLLAVMAPKPVMILANRYDFFPIEGTMRTLERARCLWKRAGSIVEPEVAFSCSGHSYTDSLARAATDFFSRHLMGHEADFNDFRYCPFSEQELWCTSHGVVLKDYPDACTIQMELEAEYDRMKKERTACSREEQRSRGMSWLKSTVFADRKNVDLHVRVYEEGLCGHYVYRALLWRAQENYMGAGVLFRDMRYNGDPLPTVVALWPGGVRGLERHSAWIHRQCEAGKQVLVAELAVSGSLEPNALSHTSLNIGWGTMYISNGFLMELGDSLAAMRIYQAVRALFVVRELPQEDCGEISFYGEGEFARYAKIAALLGRVPVEADELYQSYGRIVCEKYHDQTHTADWMLPGVLKILDMKDIDHWLAEDGLLQDRIEGGNRI